MRWSSDITPLSGYPMLSLDRELETGEYVSKFSQLGSSSVSAELLS